MPFVILFIGAVFLAAGIRGTQSNYTSGGNSYPGLFSLLQGDFSGPGNFLYWLAALGAVGAVGYVPKFKPVSNAFLVLIILQMILKNGKQGGLFDQFKSALNAQAIGSVDASSASRGTKVTTQQALNAAATQPIQGITVSPLNPGQTIPAPVAGGPM